jgi:hypothetical protein
MKENDAFLFVGNMPSFNSLLNETLSLTPEDWKKYKERKAARGAAAENTDTIPLIYDIKQRLNSEVVHENHKKFKMYIEEIVFAAAGYVGEIEVQQAMLTKLNSKVIIPRHRDRGPLTAKTHRIHVPIITNTGCIFTVGDESKNLEPGQIWIIDNVNRYHSVENNGDEDRVHLIIDAI